MFLIAGLGNIGREYENTRHNAGFNALDFISDKYNILVNRIKFKGVYGDGTINGEKVILLKPSTYMNLSGESILEAASFYKIPAENIIIIHDDISLDVGRIRIRANGSAGGHNGVKSILACLSSDSFIRIKVGVGQPNIEIVSYVLGRFSKEEKESLEKVYKHIPEVIETLISDGAGVAMNKFNGYRFEEC